MWLIVLQFLMVTDIPSASQRVHLLEGALKFRSSVSEMCEILIFRLNLWYSGTHVHWLLKAKYTHLFSTQVFSDNRLVA